MSIAILATILRVILPPTPGSTNKPRHRRRPTLGVCHADSSDIDWIALRRCITGPGSAPPGRHESFVRKYTDVV